jgi:GNAT superfamily N-acetyltransferase
VFETAVRTSLTVGAYADSGEMSAMARVVTDRATFGWICDVFVGEAWRGQGLGKALMAYLTAHPDLQGLRRLHLATRDAHGLYAQFGFGPLTGVDRWMEIRAREVYRR